MTKSICVAEDNEDLQAIFMTALAAEPYTVNLVTDGREALTFLATNAPDLLILDVNMPYVSGLEVLRFVRENATLAHTKVMIVTGNVHINMSTDANKADIVLIKPFDLFELRTLIKRLLGSAA